MMGMGIFSNTNFAPGQCVFKVRQANLGGKVSDIVISINDGNFVYPFEFTSVDIISSMMVYCHTESKSEISRQNVEYVEKDQVLYATKHIVLMELKSGY